MEIEKVDSIACIPISAERIGAFRKSTEEDQEMTVLMNTVHHGWPETKKDTPAIIHGFGMKLLYRMD